MNEEWQNKLQQDFKNGLITEDELRTALELERMDMYAEVASYVERSRQAMDAEQAA